MIRSEYILKCASIFPFPILPHSTTKKIFRISFKVVKSLIWYNVVKYSKNRNKLILRSQVTNTLH